MLGTLPAELKQKWPEHVSTLTHAYNCTKSTATGFMPYYLMFGRQPKLPIDVEFGVQTSDITGKSHVSYAQRLQSRLTWALKKAQEVNEKEILRHKKHHDRNVRCAKLAVGDQVLV